MNQTEGQQRAHDKDETGDVGNNEVGPTEKLREHDQPESELSVPGAQNADSEADIKDEKSPNTE
ncbi:MAG: hypothetical protein ABR557_03665 [Pyrinomonadaceae bacterium]